MAELSPFEPGPMTEWPADHERAVDDFTEMVNLLSTSEHARADVETHVSAVLASPTSHLLATPSDTGEMIATLTVNENRTLTGSGSVLWIDDVVTKTAWQGHGYYKDMMAAGETVAASLGDRVFLSSSTERGRARQGYERGGYKLLNEVEPPERQVIYRSKTIGKATAERTNDAVALERSFTAQDVGDIAALMEEDPAVIERNLDAALESPTTRVYVVRANGIAISGIAVANQTPIPVGRKPWLNDIAGLSPMDRDAVVTTAGEWLGSEYKHVNIVDAPGKDFGHGFEQRNSGLYVKHLGNIAAA